MGEPVLSTEQTQRSLWLGDLAPWIDENFLFSLFVGTNQLVSVKLIRNRVTGASEGYAFLEFRTHEAADTILKTYNGHPIPGTDLVFRLNWAAYGVGKTQPAGEDFSLFVGDLAPDVTDVILQEYFRQFYPSVRSAKVITDATTARSKGYGFVRFASEVERDRALNEMNGHFLSNRPIRVSLATARKNAVSAGAVIPHIPHPSDFDPTNTTLFIGGLSSQVSEDQLRAVFSRFGDIIYVKIPQGKGCGFVQFVLRTSAERAMVGMNGQVLGNSAIRISWGRSSSRAANQLSSQMTGLASGFPSGNFPGGPFAGMPPDPMLFAAVAAGGYGNVPSSAAQFVPQSGGVSANINNDFANINLNAMNTASNGIALPAPGMEALVADHHYGMPAYTPSPAHSLTGNSPPPHPHPHPPPSTGLLNGKGVAGDSLPSGVGLNGISLPVMIPQSSGAPSQVVPPSVVNVNSAPPNARNHHGSVGEGSNAISAGASPAKDGVPSLVKEYEMGGNAGNAIASANANLKTNSDSDSNTGSGKSSSAISEHAGKAAGQYNSAGKSTSSSGAMPGAQLLASLLV